MVLVLRDVGKRSRAKSYQSVSLLSVVSKIFQRHLINGHADHLDKSVFSFNCRSSTAVSDIIYKAFNRSWTTGAVAFDIFEAFDNVLYTLLFFITNSSLMVLFQVMFLFLFHHFSVIDSFRWFQM